MTNKNIFCNAPWFELQIYWDGGLGFCSQANHRLYSDEEKEKYNVANMSIKEWHNSEIMQKVRMQMFEDQRNTICRRCYYEEDHSDSSRRQRCNQKSVIFTRTNFKESYEQSPHYKRFELSRINDGSFTDLPKDIHMDLGNYCNLTCKMCRPEASSRIASQYVQWGIKEAKKYVGTNWTANEEVWTRVLNEIADLPDLTNIHFMGGETLITRRFEDLVDFMIERKRFDLCFSFVTNGTTFTPSLLDKLKKFGRVGIEVSIESLTEHNAYQRQGTDTALVLENLQKYLSYCNGTNITLTVRPSISALTIGYYPSLLRYCFEHKLMVKGTLVSSPEFLSVLVLPDEVRKNYQQSYKDLLTEFELDKVDHTIDYNESDLNQLNRIMKNQIIQCLYLLSEPRLPNGDELLTKMVEWCRKWDTVHGYDALALYPELKDEFIARGY